MEVKSISAAKAIADLRNVVKKEVKIVKVDVPQLFLEKRQYMQNDEFLNDSHNKKMLEYGTQLCDLREQIGAEIVERNKTSKDEIVQGINGFSRVKKYLEINPALDYSEQPSFTTPLESAYSILRRFKIGNAVRAVKNGLNRIV